MNEKLKPTYDPTTLKIRTGEGRVSYPHLFKPQAFAKGASSQEKYSIMLLIPKTDEETFSLLQTALRDAAIKTWGNNIPKGLRKAIQDGDSEDVNKGQEAYKGHWVVKAKSVDQPVVKLADGRMASEKDIYGGMYARISAQAYVPKPPFQNGIYLALVAVQKLRDGEPFGAMRSDGKDDFDAIVEAEESVSIMDL